jgi:hypothetical protein
MMVMNTSAIETSSDGAWQGYNPMNHGLPLLIIQTTLVMFVSRTLAFFLKPLRQPRVVAEIIVSQYILWTPLDGRTNT